MRKAVLFTIVFFTTTCLSGQVRLPRLISDGMVLQRDVPLKIWGWASPREKVTVSFNGSDCKTSADAKGNWLVTVPAQRAGGPYAMTVRARNSITVSDILIGDVWLCSGQSNMELQISRVTDMFADDIQKINNPYIRHFKTPTNRYSYEHPEQDLPGGEWKAATPENIMNFSALAYFFAENLYNRYQIPIGLFNSSVGGSPAEAWISIEEARRYPEYVESVEQLIEINRKGNSGNADDDNFRRLMESMPKDAGLSKWHKAGVDDSGWDEVSLPGYWRDRDIDFGTGVIWLRREVDVPARMAGKAGTLRLGCIVNSDSAFVNGVYVGNVTYQYPPRIYPVGEGLLKEGKNSIAVRVVCNSPYGGFVEEKPYQLIAGNETIDISGQWKYKVGVDYSKQTPPVFASTPSAAGIKYTPVGLYNSMIAPALNASIKGVIWYQGESNTGRAKEYESLFTGLIADWRNKFNNPQLPFIYVQLANFMKAQKSPQESGWAELREAQRKTLSVPHTGMAVAIDLGEWNDIHPLNKKELGRRLALEAQRVAYGESLVSRGPLYKSMEVKNNSIILTFASTGSGIYSNVDLHGFAVAGEEGGYEWANAVVMAKDKVKVWSSSVQKPVKVRYAWADNPDDVNLRNREGLPASPFCAEYAPGDDAAVFRYFRYTGDDRTYAQPFDSTLQYQNPLLSGFYPDPAICRKGNDYYLAVSSFAYYPGIPIFHSLDLVNWKQIGHVLNRPSQLNLDGIRLSGGVYAPAIAYNPHNDMFYLINTCVDGIGNFVVKTKDPMQQNWSEPIVLPKVGGIDASLFFDDDGKGYIVNNDAPQGEPEWEGHRAIWIHRYDVDADSTSDAKVIVDGGTDKAQHPVWIEAPHIYKVNGYYYLMCAEGGTSTQHSEVVFRSDDVMGPYIPWKNNPILTQRDLPDDRPDPITCAGHADLVQTPEGEWYAVFLACRPYEEGHYNTGRETFLLPVTWENEYPVILPKGESVPYIVSKQGIIPRLDVDKGNFSYCDDFSGKQLNDRWIFIRTPRTAWWSLTPDGLSLNPNGHSVYERANPAFIGSRQQHLCFEVQAELEYCPRTADKVAGLVCYQNEKYNFVFGKTLDVEGKACLVLDEARNGQITRLAKTKIPETHAALTLKIAGNGAQYSFYASFDGGASWKSVYEGADGKILSTQTAGGFTGAVIGMYAF